MSRSILQDEKECYITHSKIGLHKHHIYAGAYRKASERYGCWVYLRSDWHNMSNYGVHFNPKLNLWLKRRCQKRFEELYGHDKFMEVFHRNYL